MPADPVGIVDMPLGEEQARGGDGDQVVEVVGDPTRHLAEHLEPLRRGCPLPGQTALEAALDDAVRDREAELADEQEGPDAQGCGGSPVGEDRLLAECDGDDERKVPHGPVADDALEADDLADGDVPPAPVAGQVFREEPQ